MDFREMNQVAKAADTDWRTVRRFLVGGPMRARTKARVEKGIASVAIKKLGTRKGKR